MHEELSAYQLPGLDASTSLPVLELSASRVMGVEPYRAQISIVNDKRR